MAEQCAFYYYDSSFWASNSYCCRLLESKGREYRVGQDWAYRYCRCYDHEKCPYYNNKNEMSSGGSGCYLTSACVFARGLPDDCYELQTLRHFRDTYLAQRPDGKMEIDRYYEKAPHLVDIINQREDSQKVFEAVFQELIVPCVEMIEEERLEEAYLLYKNYTEQLYGKYSIA